MYEQTFKEYLGQFRDGDPRVCMEADLAQRVYGDIGFPNTNDREAVLEHMRSHPARYDRAAVMIAEDMTRADYKRFNHRP